MTDLEKWYWVLEAYTLALPFLVLIAMVWGCKEYKK